MVSVTALHLMVSLGSLASGVEGALTSPPRLSFPIRRFLVPSPPVSQTGCGAEHLYLNVEPRLQFSANQRTTTRSENEFELQCSSCEKSGVPAFVNCSNSNADREKSAEWFCEGPFPDDTYVVVSPEIDCEWDDSSPTNCVIRGSCILRFSSGSAGTVDWLLIFLLFQVAVMLLAFGIIESRKRVKALLSSRAGHSKPDLRIDVIEAQRRGREQIRRLHGTLPTTTNILNGEAAPQEPRAMSAHATVWLE